LLEKKSAFVIVYILFSIFSIFLFKNELKNRQLEASIAFYFESCFNKHKQKHKSNAQTPLINKNQA